VEITRIGFFHFVENYAEPVEELSAALKKTELDDIKGALVVLPEAFNLGRFYRDAVPPGRFYPTALILDQLGDLAQQFGVIFVGGVLEVLPSGNPSPPYNSAFLVPPRGSAEPTIMSRKAEQGPPGLYTTFDGRCGQNPILCGQVHIAALVCNDYKRFQCELRNELDGSTAKRKVLCVPACMEKWTFGGSTIDFARGVHVIVANCDPVGCASFIANRDGEKIARYGEVPSQCENTLILSTWSQLDT